MRPTCGLVIGAPSVPDWATSNGLARPPLSVRSSRVRARPASLAPQYFKPVALGDLLSAETEHPSVQLPAGSLLTIGSKRNSRALGHGFPFVANPATNVSTSASFGGPARSRSRALRPRHSPRRLVLRESRRLTAGGPPQPVRRAVVALAGAVR
jgi:hypothetical protein